MRRRTKRLYKFRVFFSDGSTDDYDEEYETESQAEAGFRYYHENWIAGNETLDLAGRPSSIEEIIDHEIYSTDD